MKRKAMLSETDKDELFAGIASIWFFFFAHSSGTSSRGKTAKVQRNPTYCTEVPNAVAGAARDLRARLVASLSQRCVFFISCGLCFAHRSPY